MDEHVPVWQLGRGIVRVRDADKPRAAELWGRHAAGLSLAPLAAQVG